MIQILIAVNDFIKSTGVKVDIITKQGTYINIRSIKLSDDKQSIDIVYNTTVVDNNKAKVNIKDIGYIGVHADIKI